MQRRQFITRILSGLVGACALTHIPTGWFPQDVRNLTAEKFLVKAFNDHTKGKGARLLPVNMWASTDLFESFEQNLIPLQRFIQHEVPKPFEPMLMFKSARLYKVNTPGWKVWFNEAPTEADLAAFQTLSGA